MVLEAVAGVVSALAGVTQVVQRQVDSKSAGGASFLRSALDDELRDSPAQRSAAKLFLKEASAQTGMFDGATLDAPLKGWAEGKRNFTVSECRGTRLLKIARGRGFLVELHPNGELIEREVFGDRSTWGGRWWIDSGLLVIEVGHYALFLVASKNGVHSGIENFDTHFVATPLLPSPPRRVRSALKYTTSNETRVMHFNRAGLLVEKDPFSGEEWRGTWKRSGQHLLVEIADATHRYEAAIGGGAGFGTYAEVGAPLDGRGSTAHNDVYVAFV